MRPVVVIEVFFLLMPVVEELRVVDQNAIEHPVELLAIDAMWSLDLPVEPRGRRLAEDVPVAGSSTNASPGRWTFGAQSLAWYTVNVPDFTVTRVFPGWVCQPVDEIDVPELQRAADSP
jgi:hypothetical protein